MSLQQHVKDIVTLCAGHTPSQNAVIVWDRQYPLTERVAQAYQANLPSAPFICFDEVTPDEVMAAFAKLQAGDLVVLVQSTSFRLTAFRIRVELFRRGLKVIEHSHLDGIRPGEEEAYIDSLAYDPGYYRTVGPALKKRLDEAAGAVIDSDGELLTYAGPFESAKLNVGDYTGMANIGGQFPIGEVFTEARDLTTVNGRLRIFSFGDTQFKAHVPEHPITLVIASGRVVGADNSTDEFDRVLAQIRADEDEVWVRELGFGLNRAFTPTRRVSPIGIYERMCGVHLSLGAKHNVYRKPDFRRRDGKYHVDVFAVTHDVRIDGESVFENGAWVVG